LGRNLTGERTLRFRVAVLDAELRIRGTPLGRQGREQRERREDDRRERPALRRGGADGAEQRAGFVEGEVHLPVAREDPTHRAAFCAASSAATPGRTRPS